MPKGRLPPRSAWRQTDGMATVKTLRASSPHVQIGGSLVPGLVVCALAVVICLGLGRLLPMVSPLLMAIVLGAVLSNVVRLPQIVKPGLTFSARRLLRLGVVLLGLQLLLSDIAGLGAGMIAVVIAVVAGGILASVLAGHLLGLSPSQSLLIACGFSICGAAAVAALDSVIEADEEEVVTAVALVVVFGTLMIPLVPLAGHVMGLSTAELGLWAGSSIHEVAQVVAAGGAIGGSALGLAVVVKLARVLMLAPVMATVSLRQRRAVVPVTRGVGVTGERPPVVPLFVVGFIAMAVLRSTGVVPTAVLDGARLAQTALLAAAMFALGCGVNLAALRRVGPRPVVLAVISTMIVAAISLTGVLIFG